MAKKAVYWDRGGSGVGRKAGRISAKAMSKEEFARNLYRMMVEKGWSQADLARASQLGPDTISTYVRGRSFPEPRNLEKLARAFNVAPEALLPNVAIESADRAPSVLEMKVVEGFPGVALLKVNCMVRLTTATKVLALLQEDDTDATAANG